MESFVGVNPLEPPISEAFDSICSTRCQTSIGRRCNYRCCQRCHLTSVPITPCAVVHTAPPHLSPPRTIYE